MGNDVSDDVTLLAVSPKDVTDGAKVSVRFEFNEQSKNIQPGDYFNISWPNIGNIFAQGYTKMIDLQIAGKDVGRMIVKSDGAQVIFNDNIKNLDDVKGWGEFEIQVRNLTIGNAENTGILTVNLGEKSAKVNVTKPTSGTTSSIFYYKTGDMLPQDTQHIRWFLNINYGRVEVDNSVIIKDQIQRGQQLDPSTFVINVDDVNGNKTYRGESELLKLLNDYPGLSFVYSTKNNTIELNVPPSISSYRHFDIQYKTIIENEQQVSFDNRSQAWYQEHNQPAVSGKSFDHSVQNINASGGIQGTVKGQLKIVKKVEGTEIGIPNVKFALKRADGEAIQGQHVITLTSDINGEAGIKGLQVGDYFLQEIFAPNWINFDPLTSPEQKFTINDSDTSGVDLTIFNKSKTTNVTARKNWQGGITPRPTTYFKLYRTNISGQKEVVPGATLKTLIDGITEVTWQNVVEYDEHGKPYNFTVKEVDVNGNDSVPLGYSKVENGLLVTNTNIEKTAIIGQKTWEDEQNKYGKRPDHIIIDLLEDGKEIKQLNVSAQDNWHYKFDGLPKYKDGKAIVYSIREQAVEGYQTKVEGYNLTNTYIATIIPYTLIGGSENVYVVKKNRLGSIQKQTSKHIQITKSKEKKLLKFNKGERTNDRKMILPKTNDADEQNILMAGIFLSSLAGLVLYKKSKS
ncbi:Cna B-type domain-containing protein [Lactococcus lactis]|nr:Cna B-type domain-containing protein [Lactococcus lactis]